MKKLIFTLFLVSLILSGTVYAANVVEVEGEFGPSFVGYAPDRCIVIVREGTLPIRATSQAGIAITGNRGLDEVARRFQVNRFFRQFPGAEKASKTHPVDRPLTRYYKAKFPEGNLDAVMEAYRRVPFVERVEPVGIYRINATPNDYFYDDSLPHFPYDQWHYWDTYGINADSAWDKETGDPSVICAVIDTGVRYNHYELGGTNPPGPNDNDTNGNIWVNNGEIPNNGIDDDNNGYTDDVIGWDFVESTSLCTDADCSIADNDPADHNGHGTHVAGTIAAITNNDPTWGVAGIAGGWNNGTTNFTADGVKIMCLRAGWSSMLGGRVGMDYIAEAMYYVATMVDEGYNIAAINCSWGSSSFIAAATDAVLARDVMVIVAAGNSESSSCNSYLGCREDCLDVGATDKEGYPAGFSNHGSWVDVAAPGVDILSTYHNADNPDYDYIALMSGTSMSCPHVVAVAGLLESYNPGLTALEKFDIITDIDNTTLYNQSKDVGVGIVDAHKCIDAATECDVTADFTMADITSNCAPLWVNFTDNSTGPVTTWDWNFGDDATSTLQDPSHEYNTSGTYTVTLTVCSTNCCDTMTKVDYLEVNDVPLADFSSSPTQGDAPLTVNFTDLSTGNPTGWNWTFGDGGTSSDQNTSHTYNDSGLFTVTLTAANDCDSDMVTKTEYISVTESQYAKAYALSDIPVDGKVSGSYTDTHTSDDSYEVITEVEYTGHPRKTYSYLEHKWNFNVSATGEVTFNVEAYRPNNSDGDDFTFAYSTDDITYYPLLTVASAAEQTYSAPLPNGLNGIVYIRVTDTDRNWGNVSLDQIHVDHMYIEYATTPAAPVADFTGSPTSGFAPLTVNFTDLSTGSPTEWDWDFGDGGTSNEQFPIYTYNDTGTYTVFLTVTNASGSDGETKTDYITVTEPGGTMYVYDMAVGRMETGVNSRGTCTVTIYDNENQPVPNATVYVTATGPTGEVDYNGVTGPDGTAYFETSRIKNPSGVWCFEVTDITHSSLTYNSAGNNVTEACENE